MPRSMWSGAISFGLINVPVKLISAVSRQTVRFHELHQEDGARIKHKRVCSADGEEVGYDDIVKGYELSKERYVVITPEELDRLEPRKTKTIDIEDFVDLAEIDPILYDSSYYLVPDGGPAAKAYNLLLKAMAESGKVAVGRVIIRTREHLVAIRATGDVLTMATMLFNDEVVPTEDLDVPEASGETSDRELKMAQQLIDSLTTEFDPGRYRDEYRERVLELIDCKQRGDEIVSGPEPDEPTAAPDLMAALEASIAAAAKGGDGNGDAPAKGNGSAKGDGSGAKSSGAKSSGGRKGAKAKSGS